MGVEKINSNTGAKGTNMDSEEKRLQKNGECKKEMLNLRCNLGC